MSNSTSVIQPPAVSHGESKTTKTTKTTLYVPGDSRETLKTRLLLETLPPERKSLCRLLHLEERNSPGCSVRREQNRMSTKTNTKEVVLSEHKHTDACFLPRLWICPPGRQNGVDQALVRVSVEVASHRPQPPVPVFSFRVVSTRLSI